VSRQLSGRKYGIETAVAAFTDHLAVILRISMDVTAVQRGRSYWKMIATLLSDAGGQETLQQIWMEWKGQRNLYHNIVFWWERVAKNQLRKLLITEGAMRRRDDLAPGTSTTLPFMTYYRTLLPMSTRLRQSTISRPR
jgi:hypothetical protein